MNIAMQINNKANEFIPKPPLYLKQGHKIINLIFN